MGEQVALHNDQLQLESGLPLFLSSLGHKCLLIVSYLGCAEHSPLLLPISTWIKGIPLDAWIYGMCM